MKNRTILISFILSSGSLAACEPDKSATSLNITTSADVEFDDIAGRWIDSQPMIGNPIAPPTYEVRLPFEVVEAMELEQAEPAPAEDIPVEEPASIPPANVEIIVTDIPPLPEPQEQEEVVTEVVNPPSEDEVEELLPIDLLN